MNKKFSRMRLTIILPVMLVVFLALTFSVPTKALSPERDYDYYYTKDLYMIEPMIDSDVEIISETVELTHYIPSAELEVWYTIEGPSIKYDATFVMQNDDPLKTIDVIVPYYSAYRNDLHNVVSVKLDGVKQNPSVNLGETEPTSVAYLDYAASYATSVEMENYANPVVGYLYELTTIDSLEEGYVEFQYTPLSTRIFSQYDIERLKWNTGGYHEMRYTLVEGSATLLSTSRELVWTTESNVTSTVRPIHLDEFYDLVLPDPTNYSFVQSILLDCIQQENYTSLYSTYQELQNHISHGQNVMFYRYEIPVPQGTSELKIMYKQAYGETNNDYPIFTTLVTSPLVEHPSQWPYQVTYTIDESFDYFASEDFIEIAEDDLGRYRYQGDQIPSHNLSFFINTDSGKPTEVVGDPFIIFLGLGLIMIPVVVFIGIVIVVIVIVTRKNKRKK